VIANSARLRSLAVAMVNTIPAVVDVFGIMMLTLIVVYATWRAAVWRPVRRRQRAAAASTISTRFRARSSR
jgi:hypothetical protein